MLHLLGIPSELPWSTLPEMSNDFKRDPTPLQYCRLVVSLFETVSFKLLNPY